MRRKNLIGPRGLVLAGLFLAFTSLSVASANAQALGGPITGVLGKASDNALDKLARPGAFYSDPSVRIGLPGMGGGSMSSLLSLGDKAGLTGNLTHSINDAADEAAGEAKPIFRAAINRLSLSDAPDIVSKRDGATQYLRKSAGPELRVKVRPLIVSALEKVGAFGILDRINGGGSGLLSGVGLDREGLSNTVTDQALKGIYAYMGNEEAKLRANPLGSAGSLLKGFGQ